MIHEIWRAIRRILAEVRNWTGFLAVGGGGKNNNTNVEKTVKERKKSSPAGSEVQIKDPELSSEEDTGIQGGHAPR